MFGKLPGSASESTFGEGRELAVAPLNRPRAQSLLSRAEVDVLVGTTPENVFYVTGFRSINQWLIRGSKTLVAGIVDVSGSSSLVSPAGQIDGFVDEPTDVDRVITFDSIVAESGRAGDLRPEDRDLIANALAGGRPDSFVEAVEAAVGRGMRVAVDDPEMADTLATALGIDVIDGRALFTELRLVKSDEEVARLRGAVEVTERALAASMLEVQIGMTERDLADVFDCEVIRHGGSPFLTVVGFGTFTAYGNHVPGRHRLQAGQFIRWDVGCRFRGYAADIARTAVAGAPTVAQNHAWTAVIAGHQKALDTVAPGVPAAAVYHAGIAGVRSGGLPRFDMPHCGHGIGIDMYEPPMISASDQRLLEPGMVFEVEVIQKVLGVGGPHVEDTVHVVEQGYERLTSLPHELFVVAG